MTKKLHPSHIKHEGRIVIIEGVDGTGKSTLAHQWLQSLPPPAGLLHAGPPLSKTDADEYVYPLMLAATGWTVICDRWHLGEPVWSTIFNRTPLVSMNELKYVEERIRGITSDVTAIYLHRPQEFIQDELLYRGDTTLHTIRGIELYKTAMKHSTLDWQEMTMNDAFLQFLGYDYDIRR